LRARNSDNHRSDRGDAHTVHHHVTPRRALFVFFGLTAAGLLAPPLPAATDDRAAGAAADDDPSPRPDERQLPRAMRAAPDELPRVSVGRAGTDLIGSDHRALQAAVDYIAALGGGTVEIGPGEFVLSDSLHLRSHVTVRGAGDETVLRKSDGTVSALALDGDFGEEQITVEDPTGFTVGGGVTIWDDAAGGFHTTVARITGRRGATGKVPYRSSTWWADPAGHHMEKTAGGRIASCFRRGMT